MKNLLKSAPAYVSLVTAAIVNPGAAAAELPSYQVLDECFTEIDIDLEYECGYVTVPEFHDRRTDREMRVAVYRIFATGEGNAGAPIFFLDGGPGSSMTGLISINNGNLTLNQTSPDDRGTPVLDMLEDHDFVMMSQRGAAFSEPAVLTCPEGEDSDLIALLKNLSPDEKSELTRNLYKDCLNEWRARGIDLDAYNGYEIADDVDAVRRALGYDRIIYYGLSYGAQVGQFVMQRHPEILEAAILDGANDLSKTEWEQDNGVALENAVRRLLAICAADEKCSSSFENPEGLLDAAIERLREEPLVVSYYSDSAETDVTVELTVAELGQGLAHMIGKTALFIPAMLEETARGTGRLLAEQYVGNYVGSRDNDDYPLLMHLAVVCSDDPPQKEVAFDQSGESAFAATFERSTAPWYADSCEAVGVRPMPPKSDEDVSVDIPTLILSGALDVRTPPFRNRAVAENLPNSRVVTFEYGLHVQYNANRLCVANIMSQFVDDPASLDSLDTTCVEQQTNPFTFMTLEEVGVSFDDD